MKKYLNYLMHHGVKGQKWGVQNGPPYPLDENKSDGHKLFISGTSKMENKDSDFYRKNLSKQVRDYLDDVMNKKVSVLIGDAPGADTMVQKYLAKNKYNDVTIYVSGNEVRNNADKEGTLGWKIRNIDASMYEKGSKEWHAEKDKAMTDDADSGMSIILEKGGAHATRNNIDRLWEQGKTSRVYELSKEGSRKDKWINDKEYGAEKKKIAKNVELSKNAALKKMDEKDRSHYKDLLEEAVRRKKNVTYVNGEEALRILKREMNKEIKINEKKSDEYRRYANNIAKHYVDQPMDAVAKKKYDELIRKANWHDQQAFKKDQALDNITLKDLYKDIK